MKILLIDDDIGSLEALYMTIKPTKHHCDAFQNPNKALLKFLNTHHDIVITNITMSELSDVDILKTVKKFKENVYVIMITDNRDVNKIKLLKENKAYAFFDKPLKVNEIINTILRIEREENILSNKNDEYVQIKSDIKRLRNTIEELTDLYNELKNKMNITF